MTVKEAATRLELAEPTVYRLIAAGILPAHRMGLKGRKIVLEVADVEAYWTKTKTAGAERPALVGGAAARHFG
jgi:excisionase family DNA binding protein